MKRRFFISSLSVLVLFVIGCGGVKKPDGMPALHKTTLTFQQDGTPLAGASITLVPMDAALSSWPSGGMTDAQGIVMVKTMAQFDGVPAGTFKITVIKTETEGTDAPVESSDEGGKKPIAASSVKSYYVVDAKYRTSISTDLKLEVKPGKNEETFELGKAVRELIPVYKD